MANAQAERFAQGAHHHHGRKRNISGDGERDAESRGAEASEQRIERHLEYDDAPKVTDAAHIALQGRERVKRREHEAVGDDVHDGPAKAKPHHDEWCELAVRDLGHARLCFLRHDTPPFGADMPARSVRHAAAPSVPAHYMGHGARRPQNKCLPEPTQHP